jgi:isoquinoline 1-oxidoreductase
MADTDLVPDDGGTAGSRTTPSTVPAVRKAAAAGRDPKLTKDWKILGTSLPKVDGQDMVTGRHKFPSDIERPGMLYGAVLRAPTYNSRLKSIDVEPAAKLGATVARDGDFVACAAATSYEARRALAAIEKTAAWETKPHPSSASLFQHLRATAVKEGDGRRRPTVRARGNVEQALSAATKKVSASYEVPYIQHAPMEPRAAVAEWDNGKLTVWTGTQMPHRVRQQLAEAFRIPENRVRVIVPDTGGGFGGKHTGETAVEAARIAREAGKPVKLRWSREEEFRWAYFRPAGLFQITAALDASGKITAWDYTNFNAGGAGLDSPYTAPDSRVRFLYTDSPLREGSYRGIAATANHFARELFIDELAAAASMDPLAFRLANLENERLKAVLASAAEKFGWDRRRAANKARRGVGLACGTEKGSYVAACVEVEIDSKTRAVRVMDTCHAFECGAIQNPANLRAQVEGCIIQGLGAALTEEIRFDNGRVTNAAFSQYRVPRMADVPPLDIVLVNRPELPSAGAGETPIIAIAPAIAAAVHHASGVRVRRMPVKLA